MSDFPSDPVVSAQWLFERLQDADSANKITLVDASWRMDGAGLSSYEEAHIQGAVHFDINAIADSETNLAHMLPTPEFFAAKVGALGVDSDNWVVVYDHWGLAMASARVWWMFRIFGHHKVLVLDGGLPAWKDAGYAVSQEIPSITVTHFKATLDKELVRSFSQVKANIMLQREQVLDARTAERYRGEAVEPPSCKHKGHIPNAINLPFMNLLTNQGRSLKPAAELEKIFDDLKIDRQRLITVSCGSGVTACVVALALFRIGKTDVAIYDGSWSEWGQRDDAPVMRPLREGEDSKTEHNP